MDYIPIMTTPYPDEMLYSWIYRLSAMNGLSISLFGKKYLDLAGVYSGELPFEIRHEYVRFCDNLLHKGDIAQTYLNHTAKADAPAKGP